MNARSTSDLLARHKATFELSSGNGIVLKNAEKFVGQTLDQLAASAVVGETEEVRSAARWIIRRAGLELGVLPSSLEASTRRAAGKSARASPFPPSTFAA